MAPPVCKTPLPPHARAREVNPVSENDLESGDNAEKRSRKPRAASTSEPAGEAAPAAPAATPSPAAEKPAAEASSAGQEGGGQAGGQAGGEDGNNNGGGQGGQREGGRRSRRERFRDKRFRDRDRNRDGGEGEDGNGGGQAERPLPQLPPDFPVYSLNDLKRMPAHKLLEIAEKLGLHEGVARMRKQDVTFALLKVLTRHPQGVAGDGVLEILPDGYGFLRSADA